MKTVFISYHFNDADRALATRIEQLLASHDLKATTGRRLNDVLTPAIREKIEKSHALIGLLTRRDPIAGGDEWRSHPWVYDELGMARNNRKMAVALVEGGVRVEGAESQYPWIPFSLDDSTAAFIELSERIGEWKQSFGRTIRVRLLPEEVARNVGQNNAARCRYRLVLDGAFSDWTDVIPVPEPGGTFLYLNGVLEKHSIQVSVEGLNRRWVSPATSQWMDIPLQEMNP